MSVPTTMSVRVRDEDTLLSRAHAHGLVLAADVQLAATVARLCGDSGELVTLTAALAFAAAREGSSCLRLDVALDLFADRALESQDVAPDEIAAAKQALIAELRWPEPGVWADALAQSPAVGDAATPPNSRPLRLVDGWVWLERYWAAEQQVALLLDARQTVGPPPVDESAFATALARLRETRLDELQLTAVSRAVRSWTSVVAGGPGTGKTFTVGSILWALHGQSPRPLRIALAAPSGKAASRLGQGVAEAGRQLALDLPDMPTGKTLMKLLGYSRAGDPKAGPRHLLPYDVVVVDEVSMVDLDQFGVLLSAVGPQTRLVLVGDPHQLQSVSAGTVLADVLGSNLVVSPGSTESAMTVLTRGHRNENDVARLATAINARDPEGALQVLASGGNVSLHDRPLTRATTWADFPEAGDVIREQWHHVIAAARRGDAPAALEALDRHRVLCGHRDGLFGVSTWSTRTLQLIREFEPAFGLEGDFHVGRPVILTANDHVLSLSNGDTGVVIRDGQQTRLALGTPEQVRLLSPALLRAVDSVYAMTIHKAQGSQFDEVTVVLPPLGSPLLTRDLVYTAVTRARTRVRLIGSAEQVQAAISTDVQRASGLARDWGR